MSLGIQLKFGFDELPPDDGDLCSKCNQPLIEVKYCAYVQLGEADKANYVATLCKECYLGE